jgi:hypothetical protein
VSLLTGVSAVGIEVQPALVSAARELASRLQLNRVSFVESDAADLPAMAYEGSIFFLYCPFSGDRIETLLTDLESIARRRTIRICCVDLPLPSRPWLERVTSGEGDLSIYRSTLLD